MARASTLLVAAVLISAGFSDTSFGQAAAAAAPPPPTLWSFLGIPQGIRKVRGTLTNRRGNTPRTEPREPLKALNDPENLESENPAIKKAAEVKQEEDAKPQKIKAIKYLTGIGCGCYDKDGSVSDALVAAAEDCTEDVRLTTMEEIKEAACGKCCANCGQVCCCNEKILKKLAEIAYEKDEFGCYLEPSSRVRDAAAEALAACCPGSPPLEILEEEPEEEDEEEEEPEVIALPEEEDETLEAIPETDESLDEADESTDELDESTEGDIITTAPPRLPNRAVGTGVTLSFSDESDEAGADTRNGIVHMRRVMVAGPPVATQALNPDGGVVMAFDGRRRLAYVHFADQNMLVPVGATVHLRQDSRLGGGDHGNWQVVESSKGCANLRPTDHANLAKVRVGDQVDLGPPPVYTAPASFVRKR